MVRDEGRGLTRLRACRRRGRRHVSSAIGTVSRGLSGLGGLHLGSRGLGRLILGRGGAARGTVTLRGLGGTAVLRARSVRLTRGRRPARAAVSGLSPTDGRTRFTGTRARGARAGGGLRRRRLADSLLGGTRDAGGGVSRLLPGRRLGSGRRLGRGGGRGHRFRGSLLIGTGGTTRLATSQEHGGRGENDKGQRDGEAASADLDGHGCGILSIDIGVTNTVLERRSGGEQSESQPPPPSVDIRCPHPSAHHYISL